MAITLEARKRRLWLSGVAGVALAALAALLLNVLGNWFFLRLDLTQQGAYSLSSSSRKLVKDLEDPVIIKAYFTPDLPPPYNIYERYTRDLLSEYRSASRGRVRFEFALSHPPAEFEKKASEAGLAPIQFEQVGSDQIQVRRGYMGMVLYHRDKTEVLPIVKNVQQLEYDLTSRIAKMAARKKKTIAFTTGHGEIAWDASRSRLASELSDLYEFKSITLPVSSTAPIVADALMVLGPKTKMDDQSLWAIDQAIMKGTPTAFLVDIKNFMAGQFYVSPQDAGLHELLKHYGILLGDRLIFDAQCETIGVTQNMSGFAFQTRIRYPYIPLIDRILNTHPIGRGLEAVALPFTTSVEPFSSLPSGVHFTPILYTTQKSFFANDLSAGSVAPNNIPNPPVAAPHGIYSVGGLLDGTFPSFFQSKPIPVPGQVLEGISPQNQIFVLGTSRIMDPEMAGLTGTEALMSNLLAYLSKDETLIGIRTKGEIVRPLRPQSGRAQLFIKYGTVLGSTALAILLGLWRWRQRQAWRARITAAFAAPRGF